MGNPLLKNYNMERDPFLSGGFGNLWKIYKGSRKDRKQDVSVFVLDKKVLDKFPREEREEILSVLKKEAAALSKFKHPNILGLVDPLSEDKQSLIFVTEGVEYTLTSWIESSGASKLEIKLMIAQLCKVFTFLHGDAHVIHATLHPDNIFFSSSGHIKLSGLGFSIGDPPLNGAEFKLSSMYPDALPCLNYIAPEVVQDGIAKYQSDIFSIGTIIYNMLKTHKGDNDKDILNVGTANSPDSYKRCIESLDNKLMRLSFENDDNDIIYKCLNRRADSRPNIQDLLDHVWFNDPKLKALTFIENLEANDVQKNTEFLSRFPNIIDMFENKIIERKFLPAFLNALRIETLIVPTLPVVFAICDSQNCKINFEERVWPSFKTLFQMKQIPAAGLYYLLSKLTFIGEKISNSEFASNMMNIICKALDCGVPKIQSVVLNNLPFIVKKIDSLSFKNQMYPRLINILLNTNSSALKVQILKSFLSVYSMLDQNIINESLLNNLDKVKKADNSPEVCMCIISIYEEIAKVVSIDVILT